ncbi:PRAME family member 12-like [Thomomys bottae]
MQHLAMQSLLSNQSLAISALKNLPNRLFPALLQEAYAGGHKEVVEAMVQDWPFRCLHLGNLAESPDLEIFLAILDGLNLLLAKKECPNSCKLQVLDILNEHSEIETPGCYSMAGFSYQGILTKSPCPGMFEEQCLTIIINVVIKDAPQDNLQTHLLQWISKRKEPIQLFSKKLQILSDSISEIQKALLMVRLDSIHELVVSHFYQPEALKTLAPYLGQMKNLHSIHVSTIYAHLTTANPKNFWYSCKLGEYLGQLLHLQELYLHDCFLFNGELPVILGNLAPLKTLSLTLCVIEESDLWLLSRCPCTSQLKHLRLRTLAMETFPIEPLRALLEKVGSNLETLALEECFITDAQIPAILPALSQCAQLRVFSFYGNCISMATLKNLLRYMARLGHLRRGLYPAPVESYMYEEWWLEIIDPEKFAQVCTGLAQALRDIGTRQKIQICISIANDQNKCQFYSLGHDGSWVVTEEWLPDLSAVPV